MRKHSSGSLEIESMEVHVLFNESVNEVVAVVITSLHTELEVEPSSGSGVSK
jgi:hypothetical protein